MRAWWPRVFGSRRRSGSTPSRLERIKQYRDAFAALDLPALTEKTRSAPTVHEVIAAVSVVAAQALGVKLFDVQLTAALALAGGDAVVEMQTGEGKTLAAVPAIVWHARGGRGVHVLTANDYLARRDAAWMGPIYEALGLSVAAVQQDMTAEQRLWAYACDVTYATANEVGFDYLRDQPALFPGEQVLRPFSTAVIDEADSILIDEARIPLVIAGGASDGGPHAARADRALRRLSAVLHFTVEPDRRNVSFTPAGIRLMERALGCDNLFAPEHLPALAAAQDALHAHTLLHRDVDYVVHEGRVLSVDEFKGRIVRERRWPAGLQTALEWKEHVPRQTQGHILGSITVQNLVALYDTVCGMTGTAVTQAEEFRALYGLDVVEIPTNQPVLRDDRPDRVFDTLREKESALVAEIRAVHETGRPVLVGTSSVLESERLSGLLGDIPHHVLNARNEEAEAAIVARAGERGAVTISTNMAGRGVDIRLDPGVAPIGGLHVIGTNRHESRRIDHQLRGRAGRQGDPGSSQFFVSLEDPLMTKVEAAARLRLLPDSAQRIIEGEQLDARMLLRKYESILEGQRRLVAARRQDILTGAIACESALERLVTLQTIDDLWADYLSAAADARAGTVWTSLGAADPFGKYLGQVHEMFQQFERAVEEELPERIARARTAAVPTIQRGATWTYLTTDEPFGPMTARIMRGLSRLFSRREG